MIRLAFYSDDGGAHTGIWDQLRRAYGVAEVYEIGGELANANPGRGWFVVPSIEEVPGDRIAFSPRSAKVPGTVALDDVLIAAGDTLVFGANHRTNVFEADIVAYIDTPGKGSLWSFSAAAIALDRLLGVARG